VTDIQRHTLADALHRLADLVAAGRVEDHAGLTRVAATDEVMVADLVAAMDPDTVDELAVDGQIVWSGRLLGRLTYVRLVEEPSMAQVAAALLSPDAEVAP
jgi:hypothetical protein